MVEAKIYATGNGAACATLGQRLRKLGGGVSHFSGFGEWESHSTRVIREPVYLYVCIMQEADEQALFEILREFKEQAGQEEVFFTINRAIEAYSI